MADVIKFIKGDATNPISTGNKIIVHVCNDIGAWGKGFVLAISKKWKEPEKLYKEWYLSKKNFSLGQVQFIKVTEDIWVANLIGQRNIRKDKSGTPPIRYDSLAQGLEKVQDFANELSASIHMPRIGCGLAGGKWDRVELIIVKSLTEKHTEVTVYDWI